MITYKSLEHSLLDVYLSPIRFYLRKRGYNFSISYTHKKELLKKKRSEFYWKMKYMQTNEWKKYWKKKQEEYFKKNEKYL